MRYDFVIILRRARSPRTDLAGFCLLLFSFIAFLSASLKSSFSPVYPAVAACAMLTGLIVNGLRARQRENVFFRIWLLTAAAGWLLMPYGRWFTPIFLLYAVWESRARLPERIGFSTEEVVIEGFIRKRIPWSALGSVMLKDGMLTLDFKNNRLLQREEEAGRAQDEPAFNSYCIGQLNRVRADAGSRGTISVDEGANP